MRVRVTFLAKETYGPALRACEKPPRSFCATHTGQVPLKADAQWRLLSAAAVDPIWTR
jgi:hypothetical protein